MAVGTLINTLSRLLGLPTFPKKGVNKFQYLDTRFRSTVSVSGPLIAESISVELGESLMCGTKFLEPNPLTPSQALPPHIIATPLSYLLNFGGLLTNVSVNCTGTNAFSGLTSISGQVFLNGAVTLNGINIYSVFAPISHGHSDRRLKQNIHTITNPIEKVSALRGVNFEFIKDGKKQIGVIAQETEEIIPEVIGECPDGYKTVQYGNIVGLLIEAIKEQQKQIDELKEKINE
tara:strand:- start:610 stop:1308 length:699 start_codon:yes stop_codon:yes gene_type:complete